jgi:3',5'-cyclic AMP phosphodiesterase CpdA
MKLIHITDTHFVTAGEILYGLDTRARLDACIADINLHHPDAELCVITGDLAHRGEAKAYAHLRASLAWLQVPWRLLIGNHDDRTQLLAAFPETPSDEYGFIQSTLDTSAGRLMFLDTVFTGIHAGGYCERRLVWLENQLEAAKDLPVYLFLHHPPFAVGLKSLDAFGIHDGALGQLIASYPNVRHLFFGHVHRPIAGTWKDIGFSTLRATSHQFWLDFTTEELPISHEPPAYAVVLIEGDRLIVHFHDYLYEHPLIDLSGTVYAKQQRLRKTEPMCELQEIND